jgi:hypothetical protein
MRNMMLAIGAIAFALGSMNSVAEADQHKRKKGYTTLGCKIGKEKWDASVGRCVAKPPTKAKAPKEKPAEKKK